MSGEASKKDCHLVVDERYQKQIEIYQHSLYTMDLFGDLITSITQGTILKQHYGMIGIRKILSIAQNPPIQAVIDAGLVPKLIEYAKQFQYPQLQFEAAWALSNITSGTTYQFQSIIDQGGIPVFVDLLLSKNMGVVQQAIWAIGNISSDCVFYRDNIIKAGGLINLVDVTKRMTDDALIKLCCWALSNLCRGSPLPKYNQIRLAISVICAAIAEGKLTDKQIVADCCWAISYHSSLNIDKIQVVLDTGIIPQILKHLDQPNMGLLIPSIRILGNISTGSAQQTNQLLKQDVLVPIEKALGHQKKTVRREASLTLSNIIARSKDQIYVILARQLLMKRLFQLFQTDGNDVKRQICFIFSNMTQSGDPATIFNFYQSSNIIRYYVKLLTVQDQKTVEVALECLYIILQHGEKARGSGKNALVMELQNLGSVGILQKLQYHKSDLVYKNVSKILQTFFQIPDPLEF